jgi:hypothetical protein
MGRVAVTRIRSGHHELRITTGEWEGLEERLRVCLMCAAAVETVDHFLLDCTHYRDERTALFTRIDELVHHAAAEGRSDPDFSLRDQSRVEQMSILLGGTHRSISRARRDTDVRRSVLIAIGDWWQQHHEHLCTLKSVPDTRDTDTDDEMTV